MQHLRLLSFRNISILAVIAIGGWVGYHIATGRVIEYEVASRPYKVAHVVVPETSQSAFIEAVKAFGSDRRLETVMVQGPMIKEVNFQLSNDVIDLSLSNPFSDSTDYSIGLHIKEEAANPAEIDEYWIDLKSRLNSVSGVSNWVENK